MNPSQMLPVNSNSVALSDALQTISICSAAASGTNVCVQKGNYEKIYRIKAVKYQCIY